MLRKMLKYRLPTFKSERFFDWFKNKHQGLDPHHVMGRRNDYLMTPLTRAEHTLRHSKGGTNYFEEDLITAIENLITYTMELEKCKH